MEKQPAVYILASGYNGTLYIGVTSNLPQRIWQHKNAMVEGFTRKYAVHCLVYYEMHERMLEAIQREKQLKKWNRQCKDKFDREGQSAMERLMGRRDLNAVVSLSLLLSLG